MSSADGIKGNVSVWRDRGYWHIVLTLPKWVMQDIIHDYHDGASMRLANFGTDGTAMFVIVKSAEIVDEKDKSE